ncbi:anaerobic sulfatase-maturation protein [Coraliomargarita sp. W4R53]
MRANQSFHIMTKPAGPLCNLDCTYCFYLEKTKLFPANHSFKMSDAVLETYIKGYIDAQPGMEVSFAWQGGEPTLAGLPFFKKVIELQKRYAGGKRIENAFQTNGTLLADEWCEFLKANDFLVGVSIDGPEELHDAYRVDRKGLGTYRQVVRGIELCKKHGVEFNTLTVVNAKNVQHPLEVYRFLREIGSQFIQFIPLVERRADSDSNQLGLGLSHPPDLSSAATMHFEPEVTDWSVPARALGDFYCKIFDRWVGRDVGRVYVQLFDVTLGKWVGAPGGVCMYAETCGRAVAMEHNGDLYACDHYVYPRYHLGNVMNQSIASMVDSDQMREFGEAKRSRLPKQCRECEVRFCCNGDCPKHRFARTKDGEYGVSYLCAGLKQFFQHSAPAMKTMAQLYQNQRSPMEIMKKSGK